MSLKSGPAFAMDQTNNGIPAEALRDAVNKICAHRSFSHASMLKAFLRFVVEQHLVDPEADIKEYIVATSVFGREAAFDPALNSIVRTQAVKLRAKLRAYYAEAGRNDAVFISLHPGRYSPSFEWRRDLGTLPDDPGFGTGVRFGVARSTLGRKLSAPNDSLAQDVNRDLLLQHLDWTAVVGSASAGPLGEGVSPSRELLAQSLEGAFLEAILKGEKQAAWQLIRSALQAGHSHIDLYVEVLTEALHRVGTMWQRNEISIAHEHAATALTQQIINNMYPLQCRREPERGTMLVACVEGEFHQLGANIFADAMELMGWRTRLLGANCPNTAIVQAIEDDEPDVLCVSTTLPENLPTVAELIRNIRKHPKNGSFKIFVGGSALDYEPQFPAENGVLGGALNLREAIRLLC